MLLHFASKALAQYRREVSVYCFMKAVCFFRGYYPKGGGKITVEIPPVQHLNSVELVDPGKVTKIWGTAFTAGNCPYAVSLNLSSYCIGIVLLY